MDFNQITKAFLAMREARAALKKEYDTADGELKGKQVRLEAVMLDHLNTTGTESVRTEAGTFFRQEKIRPSASDWQAFYDWIKENDAFDALERRVKATFISEHMEMNDGELPPGISIHREFEVRVRRAN